MRTIILAIMVILLASVVSAAPCVKPIDELDISGNMVFCPGTYRVEEMKISTDNVMLDCGNAILEGNLRNLGLSISRKKDIEIKNCHFIGYKKALSISGSEVTLKDTELSHNVIAIHQAGQTKLITSGVKFTDNENDGVEQLRVMEERPPEKTITTVENEINEHLFPLVGITEEQHLAVVDKVKLDKKVTVTEKESEFVVTLTPLMDIDNLIMYEHIPKHLAEHASEVEFDHDVIVINEDPDFMIPIGRVKMKTKIEVKYKLGKRANLLREMPTTILAEELSEEPEQEITVEEEVEEGPGFFAGGIFKIFMIILIAVVSYGVYRFERKFV